MSSFQINIAGISKCLRSFLSKEQSNASTELVAAQVDDIKNDSCQQGLKMLYTPTGPLFVVVCTTEAISLSV